jgi:hypothetical protein
MPKRVPVETIRRQLREGYGMQDYYDFLRQQQSFLYLGESDGAFTVTWPHGEQDLPSYPDVPPRRQNLAKSLRILNTSVIAASRTMGSDPLPAWDDIDPMEHEFRRSAFQRRYREQEMQEDNLRAWWDGYNLGVGGVQVGFLGQDGKQVVGTSHINAQCITWDPLSPSPVESDWVAVTRFLTEDEARATYPSIGAGRTTQLVTDQMTRSMEVVRVIEYWHKGSLAYEPTYAVFAGPLEYGPVKHQSNPWGNRIPVAFYVHLCLPGMQRPVGQVWLQMASQIQINEIEGTMLDKANNGHSMDVVDFSKIDKRDYLKWAAKKQRFVRTTEGTDANIAFNRVPESPIEATSLTVLQYLEERLQESSGMSDLDRGSGMSGERSATEISVLDARSQMNQAFVSRQTALFLTRFADIMSRCLALGDTAPCEVEWDGQTYTINSDDPDLLELTMAQLFEQEARVQVDQDALTVQQSVQRKRAKAADFMQVLATPLGQLIPPQRALKILMQNLGLESEFAQIEDEIQQQPQEAAPPMMGGLPGTMAPQMPAPGVA